MTLGEAIQRRTCHRTVFQGRGCLSSCDVSYALNRVAKALMLFITTPNPYAPNSPCDHKERGLNGLKVDTLGNGDRLV